MHSISVIIVSWNARDLLRDCLTSIEQSAGECVGQIIVVDNASTDGSPEMVSAEFPHATLVRCETNLGFAKANNLGILRASGPLLAFINSDVIVHPGCLQTLARHLENNPQVGLVGPLVLGKDGKVQRTCRKLPTVWNTFCRALALDNVLQRYKPFSGREMRNWSQDSLAEIEVLSGCFWMARRDAVQQVGGLDERFFFYAEDVDWCKRFHGAGWKVVFVPQATATHYGGGSSVNAPLRYEIELLRANRIYWRKHGGLLGQILFVALAVVHHLSRFGCRAVKVLLNTTEQEARYQLKRNSSCLRWLLTGRGP